MKKKILVCGSTGFLVSNFIRYLLYRSKDYKIISVDNLTDPEDNKRIYHNKNHKFYIGDFSNEAFLYKLIELEKPDVILCTDEITEYSTLLKNIYILTNLKDRIPIITILPEASNSNLDSAGLDLAAKNLILESGNKVVELPNKFGMRQKPDSHRLCGNVARIINDCLFSDKVAASTEVVPWVYAEDVASFIWYALENDDLEYIMPPLGKISEKEMVTYINRELDKNVEVVDGDGSAVLISKYDYLPTDWVPDSTNLEEALVKTIKWFNANRWALKGSPILPIN
jgi:nucleoside-diphosphate-sugar epimerase